jgi:hypothetical protein
VLQAIIAPDVSAGVPRKPMQEGMMQTLDGRRETPRRCSRFSI